MKSKAKIITFLMIFFLSTQTVSAENTDSKIITPENIVNNIVTLSDIIKFQTETIIPKTYFTTKISDEILSGLPNTHSQIFPYIEIDFSKVDFKNPGTYPVRYHMTMRTEKIPRKTKVFEVMITWQNES